MIRQRLRGILCTTIATCVPWTLLGLVTGVVFQLDLIPGVHASLGRSVPGDLVTVCTLVGAMIGVVNGLALAGLILATEHGKTLRELRRWRFAMWGALATAATLGLFFESPLGATIGAMFGAGAGFVTLSAARRVRVAQGPLAEHAIGGGNIEAPST